MFRNDNTLPRKRTSRLWGLDCVSIFCRLSPRIQNYIFLILIQFEKMIEKHKYTKKDVLESFQKMNIVEQPKSTNDISSILQVEICLFNKT